MPPTERSGRVHTSSVTVAIIDPSQQNVTAFSKRDESDFVVQWFSGSGNGGQNKNKTQNSCRLIHKPTGAVRTAQARDRSASYRDAMKTMSEYLDQLCKNERRAMFDDIRRDQIGTGIRADKIRTYRFRDDRVEDHRSNKGASCKQIMKGNFDLLWS